MEHSSEYFIYSYIYIIYTPPFPFPVLTWARPSCYLPCHLGSQQICTTGGVCPHSTKIFPEFPLNGFSLTPTPNRLSLQTLIQTLPCLRTSLPTKIKCGYKSLCTHFSLFHFECLEGRVCALTYHLCHCAPSVLYATGMLKSVPVQCWGAGEGIFASHEWWDQMVFRVPSTPQLDDTKALPEGATGFFTPFL